MHQNIAISIVAALVVALALPLIAASEEILGSRAAGISVSDSGRPAL